MDLSVDITSAVHEVVEKRPDLSWQEAARSGLNVGRGRHGHHDHHPALRLLRRLHRPAHGLHGPGTPVDHILNYKYVASEIIHTVIGSFGLVTVAPFTALCAGLFLARRRGHPQPQEEADG